MFLIVIPSSVRVPELTLPISEITQLSIALPDSDLSLEKQDSAWFVREPVAMPADSVTVVQVLTALEDLSPK